MLNGGVGVKRVIKPLVEATVMRASTGYRIQKTVSDLILSGRYIELRGFLKSERENITDKPFGEVYDNLPWRKKRYLLRILRDYSQFFGTFTEALRARVGYQDFVHNSTPSWRRFLIRREMLQIRLEGLTDSSLGHRIVNGSYSSTNPPKFIRREKPRSQAEKRAQRQFDHLIAGKKVLILGPAPGASVTQDFVSQFDVLAIPKLHKGGWLGEGIKSLEHQIVVTYLNHQTVARVVNEGSVSTSEWSIARVKSVEDVEKLSTVLSSNDLHNRQVGKMSSPGRLMMNDYGPFMGPAVVFDLLCAKPHRLYLAGLTFYVDREGKSYRETYDSSNHADAVLVAALRTHGAFSNFMFVKRLREMGLVEVEASLGEILNMTAHDYAEYLDTRFNSTLKAVQC